MKIVFIGTGDIGLPSLRQLIASPDHEVLAVVTQPDKPVGRKQELSPPEVKRVALEAGIPVHQPEKLRSEDALDLLENFEADVFVVMAYGQILKKRALEAPRLACLNVHASILPRHRGAAPIQAAIREGDTETGITIMYMDEGLDTGDELLTFVIPVDPRETGESLHDKLAEAAPVALMRALLLLKKGQAPRTPQDARRATLTGKLMREDGRIDWAKPAVEIERLVRAYEPWPGTWTLLNDGEGGKKKLKIFPPCEIIYGDAFANPGTVLSAGRKGIIIATGKGALAIRDVQLEGKKRMDAAAFLAGNELDFGALLG